MYAGKDSRSVHSSLSHRANRTLLVEYGAIRLVNIPALKNITTLVNIPALNNIPTLVNITALSNNYTNAIKAILQRICRATTVPNLDVITLFVYRCKTRPSLSGDVRSVFVKKVLVSLTTSS